MSWVPTTPVARRASIHGSRSFGDRSARRSPEGRSCHTGESEVPAAERHFAHGNFQIVDGPSGVSGTVLTSYLPRAWVSRFEINHESSGGICEGSPPPSAGFNRIRFQGFVSILVGRQRA